jgi:hypothetical protein
METKFTSKKDKVSINTESNIEGINISIHVYGQKIVTGNGEQLSSGHVAGNANEVIQSADFAKLKSIDIQALINKAIEDFKNQ